MHLEPSYSTAFTWYRLRRAVYDHFVDEAKAGMRVLDVGCGSGPNIKMINDLFPQAKDIEYYGVDISPRAIEAANEYKGKAGIENCLFELGDAENLRYRDAEFDIVICTEVLEHLPHPRAALREIHRVLKNGGASIITTPNRGNVLKRVAGRGIKDRIERDVERLDPYQLRDNRYGHISVLSSKELLAMSKDIGFEVEKVTKESLVFGLPFFDRHQVLFALLLIADSVLDRLPRSYKFSWGVVVKLRKAPGQ